MTAPLTTAEDRRQNRLELVAMCAHLESEIEYYRAEIARCERLLEGARRAIGKLDERAAGSEGSKLWNA